MAQQRREVDDSVTRMAWRLSGMGVEFVTSVAGMAVLGWLLDRWLGSTPRWTIVGLIVGLIGGAYNFMRQALRAARAADRAYRQAHPRHTGGVGSPQDQPPDEGGDDD